jgi:hypothetical protein
MFSQTSAFNVLMLNTWASELWAVRLLQPSTSVSNLWLKTYQFWAESHLTAMPQGEVPEHYTPLSLLKLNNCASGLWDVRLMQLSTSVSNLWLKTYQFWAESHLTAMPQRQVLKLNVYCNCQLDDLSTARIYCPFIFGTYHWTKALDFFVSNYFRIRLHSTAAGGTMTIYRCGLRLL